MADAAPLVQNMQALNALLGIPKTLFGSSTNTTETISSGISQAGIAALLKSLMEGTSGKPGLAAVAAGEKAPGLYNTTSRTLLVNDLLARAAAEAEKAGTGTTRSLKQEVPGMMSKTTGLLAAAALLGGTAKGRKMLGDAWDSLGVGFGDSTAGTDFVSSMAAQDFADFGQAGVASLGNSLGFSQGLDWLGGALTEATPAATYAFTSPFGSIEEAAGLSFGIPDATGFALTSGVDSILGSIPSTGWELAEEVASLGIGDIGAEAGGGIPGVGAVLNLAQGNVGSAAGSVIGNMILPGLGGFIGSMLGGVIDDGCFITTAICSALNKGDNCDELQKLRNFRDSWLKDNKPDDIEEYYRIAPDLVHSINLREDAIDVWASLYLDYIVPALEAIDAGEPEYAYTVYRDLVESVKEYANG